MTPTLEIVIPVRNPDATLLRTAASLAAQTDRRFEVLLSGNSRAGLEQVEEAARQLVLAGITVRRADAPGELKRLEHWNLAHSLARGDWLKPLLPGDVLTPEYVERLKLRLEERPEAQFVRCDAELRTEWGWEILRAPFDDARIGAAQFGDYFPAKVEWICRLANVAYSRIAWLASGGYCNQLPGFASLNLNVTLALHHGLENIAEALVRVESADRLPLNESTGERVNLPLELWLALRQARNYCIAAKVPWRRQWPCCRAAAARMGHW
jgi:glycosyltransferase involved in cell wall biosynthesis